MNSKSNTIQAFWVAFGSVISYTFILLSSMILSRYFTKGDYGTYKQVMYVYNSLLVVFTLGLPRAYSYFLPRVPITEAKSVINKITYLFFLLGLIFSLVLYFGSSTISTVLKNPDLNYALKVFSIVPLFMLPTMGVDGILATFKKSKYIVVYKGLSALFQLISVSVPVIFFKGDYLSAIFGFTVSSFLIFIVALYLKNMPVKNEIKEKTTISYKDIFKFSIPLLTASLWAILMNAADQFFISNYFGKEVFAEFSNGWLDLPFVSMIVGATSTVLLPVFSKIVNENENAYLQIKPIWKNTFEKTVMIIYPLLMYCMVFSENIMIVDLVRNDLSKTAQKNSVQVEELCKVYSFKQVHQMISTVVSTIKDDVAPVECIKTTFPMGSMTGAPKISAMQIIEELEETKRGLYSGAVGYFTPNGDFDFNVVIRSILYNAQNNYLSFSVGSAITSKSNPENEYEECLLKAKAMFEVLQSK